jgi:hypothetical protein
MQQDGSEVEADGPTVAVPTIAFIEHLATAIPGVQVAWVCFENDLDKANHNCRHRKIKADSAAHIAQNEDDSKNYTISARATVRPIHVIPVTA